MLFDLEPVGDPDDGMIAVYTGCVNGNGNRVIAVIDLDRIINKSKIAEKALSNYLISCKEMGFDLPNTDRFTNAVQQALIKKES